MSFDNFDDEVRNAGLDGAGIAIGLLTIGLAGDGDDPMVLIGQLDRLQMIGALGTLTGMLTATLLAHHGREQSIEIVQEMALSMEKYRPGAT